MFVHMGDTDHVHVHWLSLIIKVEGFTGPCPAVLVLEACGTSSECVEYFLRHTFSKCPFFPQPLHGHVHSFAVLYLLVSAFPTSVASVLWEWKLPTLSTRFRTCSMAPITPLAVCTCTRLCGFLTLLTFGGFSILDIVHLCSLLHSVQMLLCGDFQPCSLHNSV